MAPGGFGPRGGSAGPAAAAPTPAGGRPGGLPGFRGFLPPGVRRNGSNDGDSRNSASAPSPARPSGTDEATSKELDTRDARSQPERGQEWVLVPLYPKEI